MDGLRAEAIGVRFGGLVALDGVSLAAPPGRVTSLIGPNGAGKTTTFNVCCGFLTDHEGTVYFDGVDISRETPTRRARRGIGRTFQRMELFRSLTVRENVALAAESLHVGPDPLTQMGVLNAGPSVRRQIAADTEEMLALTGLAPFADRLAGQVSSGQGRLIELARALVRRPRLLLLDEPSSGLDVAESHRFGELLRGLVANTGMGILMIEHDMSLALGISDWVYVLDFGRPLMDGPPADVRSSDVVRKAYLGTRQGVA